MIKLYPLFFMTWNMEVKFGTKIFYGLENIAILHSNFRVKKLEDLRMFILKFNLGLCDHKHMLCYQMPHEDYQPEPNFINDLGYKIFFICNPYDDKFYDNIFKGSIINVCMMKNWGNVLQELKGDIFYLRSLFNIARDVYIETYGKNAGCKTFGCLCGS